MTMVQLNVSEQQSTASEVPILQRRSKKARLMGTTEEMMSVRVAPLGRTARERAMNHEKERMKKRAEREERRREQEVRQAEVDARAENAENERAAGVKILEWIEKIPECPVFKPTKDEFADPLKYIESLGPKVAPEFGICKVIPPYVPHAFSGRNKFHASDFLMEVRKQQLKMVDWKNKETKGVSFDKDTKMWTVKRLEEFANEFVQRNYEGSSSQLQLRFIELEFWKEFLLRQNKHVRYASDVPGTAFDDFEELAKSDWNLGKLPMLRESVLRIVENGIPVSPIGIPVSPIGIPVSPIGIPGVTQPMLYVGMLFSMFAWHTEDQYLYSINYHHLGAPKTWYGVPGGAAEKFERVAADKVFSLALDPDNLGHALRLLIGKTIMFPPGLLVDAKVPVCRAVQMPGEYVITFPRSYHAGFSNGFNTGEAVNFAMPDWFAYGAACTRRYRLLRQIQVVAYDELLCKEAQQVYARMGMARRKGVPMELSGMDKHTMVEFVRLLRWQHWQRWKLHQLGAQPRPIKMLLHKSMECALCNHKNYLAYVLCDCREEIICLNHCAELLACSCQPQPRADGQHEIGRVVMYAQELPLLERIAEAFEQHEGIAAAVEAAARDEQHDHGLRDEWELCGRTEAVIGNGWPTATTEDGVDMRAYHHWAPIPGYCFDQLHTMRLLQPGTPTQQSGGDTPEQPLLLPAAESSEGACVAMQTDPPHLPFSPPPQPPSAQPQPATPPLVAPTSVVPATTPAVPPSASVVGREAEALSQGTHRRRRLGRATSGTSGSGAMQEEGQTGGERKRKAEEGGMADGSAAEAARGRGRGAAKEGGFSPRSAQQTRHLLGRCRSGGGVVDGSQAMEVEGEADPSVAPGVPAATAIGFAVLGGAGVELARGSSMDASEDGGSWDGTADVCRSPPGTMHAAQEGPLVVDPRVAGGGAAAALPGAVGLAAGASVMRCRCGGDDAAAMDDREQGRAEEAACGASCAQAIEAPDAEDCRSNTDFEASEPDCGPAIGMGPHGVQEDAREGASQAASAGSGHPPVVGGMGASRSPFEGATNGAREQGVHAGARQATVIPTFAYLPPLPGPHPSRFTAVRL